MTGKHKHNDDEMTPRGRNFILLLTMLALPLQGVLAAVMPLCSQASQARHAHSGEAATRPHPLPPGEKCNLHDQGVHEEDGHGTSRQERTAAADDPSLSCDGVVCHISGNSLPPAASALSFAGGFSYAPLLGTPFSSIIPPQPQRPPLA